MSYFYGSINIHMSKQVKIANFNKITIKIKFD